MSTRGGCWLPTRPHKPGYAGSIPAPATKIGVFMPYKDPKKRRAFQREYQKKWIAQRRDEWLIANGPCVECGSWENLQIDHKDPNTKVSHRIWSWAKERREAELAKCQAMCEKCHNKKSAEEKRKPVSHGTHCAYASGCRCPACRQAQKEYMQLWRQPVLV